jgi:hypothetical protein
LRLVLVQGAFEGALPSLLRSQTGRAAQLQPALAFVPVVGSRR